MENATKEIVSEKVECFINELNSRYKSHIADETLKHLVIYLIQEAYNRFSARARASGNMYMVGTLPKMLHTIAYSATVGLFESVLEHDCEAGGNGHHVAQDLAKLFKE
jgi:hypothetical protein